MPRVPASIRTKNPGAMWGSALARKWGALPKAEELNDGLGQGNNIAIFRTYEDGICAQLDLWRSSPRYKNKKFSEAIAVWSGGNHVESYIKFVLDRVPGMQRDTIMNDDFWNSKMGIQFLKAQAWHEAGVPYPATERDWINAQRRVMGAKRLSAPVLAEVPEPKPIWQSKIIQGAAGTAGSIAVSGAAKVAENANKQTETVSIHDVADKVQQASDAVTTVTQMKDSATVVVQTVKPFLGVSPNTWAIVAVVALAVAAVAIGYTIYQRYAKMRDQGV